MSFEHKFEFLDYKKTAQEVFVTGEFDNWQKTVKLDKIDDNLFVAFVKINKTTLFKYVVDDVWILDKKYPQITDSIGNVNCLLNVDQD